MNRAETITLWRRCQEKRAETRVAARALGKFQEAALLQQQAAEREWNVWALGMQAERKALEAGNEWEVKGPGWLERAMADFSAIYFIPRGYTYSESEDVQDRQELPASSHPDVFPPKTLEIDDGTLDFVSVGADGDVVDFGGFIFPAGVLFESTAFHARRCSFDGAKFCGVASFRDAKFHGEASFSSVIFHQEALFLAATFRRVWFGRAQFHGMALFDQAQLVGEATFFEAGELVHEEDEIGPIDFSDAVFNGYTSFSKFTWDDVIFVQVAFHGFATFENARFGGRADFTGIAVDGVFNLSGATFKQIPKFNQANFREAPDFDGIEWPLPGFFSHGSAEDIPKYRALRRIAVQAHDYELEHVAFKGDLRSRRRTTDSWISAGLWLGAVYDFASDCGRSMVRPFVLWCALTFLSAAYYFWMSSFFVGRQDCTAESCGRVVQSLFLSVKNALVALGGYRDVRVTHAYQCLFGGGSDQPAVPAAVTFVETLIQTPASAVLLFWLLLAVRNRFRIK
jgi:uncharacterized protein YjbI with pentapeptide repeats